MNTTIIAKLDDLANELENMGLIKEATSLDVVSNTLEREAALETLKSWAAKIPELAKIRNKQQALSVIWNAVKQIGKDRVIEVMNAVLKVMSQQTPLNTPTPDRVAGASESIRDLVRMFGYPALIAAAIAFYLWVGKPGIDNLKQQISQQQQSYVNQIEQTIYSQ